MYFLGGKPVLYYFHQLGYYQYPYSHFAHWPTRQYPHVDPKLLYQSANHTKKLMADASQVLSRLSLSKEFDAKLMFAAEQSDIKEVRRLIQSIGVKSDVDIHYNPDGLRLEFSSKAADCCRLLVSLRWR
jgi:hypothetical protein